MTWKQALTRAINAEVAAEKAATVAEAEKRSTWWATTWALAAVPRAEWGEAQAEYVKRTNHSKGTANNRRQVGVRFTEVHLGVNLPQPRFARAAVEWVGKDGDEAKVKEAIKLLADAEKNEQSLREFNQALTGRPWTNAPENMTEADEDAVVEKVAKTRPIVVARQSQKPAVAEAVMKDPDNRRSIIKGARRVQSEAAANTNMPPKKTTAPADRPTPVMTALELQALITEFHVLAADASAKARKALDVVRTAQEYLNNEQAKDLYDVASDPINAWEMVRDYTTDEGATDQALADLINQEQGEV